MRTDGGGEGSPSDTAPADGRPFPFWVLQLTELVVAVVLVDVSVHVRGGGLLVAVAGVLAVLAVSAEGPLGIVRLCPQRLHVVLAVTAGALAAAAPVLPVLRPDIEGIIVLEFGAVGLIRMATLTRTSEYRVGVAGTRRGKQGRGARQVIDATASVVEPPAPAGPAGAGGPAGNAEGSGKDADPIGIGGAARRAGRAAGAAAASGRRLAATQRPAAEAGVKRSIRHAGRWAGRLASRVADPDSGR